MYCHFSQYFALIFVFPVLKNFGFFLLHNSYAKLIYWLPEEPWLIIRDLNTFPQGNLCLNVCACVCVCVCSCVCACVCHRKRRCCKCQVSFFHIFISRVTNYEARETFIMIEPKRVTFVRSFINVNSHITHTLLIMEKKMTFYSLIHIRNLEINII